MLKFLRKGGVALATLALAGIASAAHAACVTPTLTGLTGLNASSAPQTLATVTQSSQQMALHIGNAWNGTLYAPLTTDALCNLNVNIQAGSISLTGQLPGFAATPTVNLGTIGGAATAANQPSLNGDGGALAHVTNFPATQAISDTALESSASTTATNTTGIAGTQGALADAACATDNGTCSTQALIKRLNQRITALITALGSPVQAGGSLSVSNFPATQPVSATALPLPAGASTAANQTAVQSAPGTSATTAVTVQGSATGVALPVTGTVTANASIASGADVVEGTQADSAYTGGASGSVIALLKGLYTAETTGSIPAGSAIIGKVGIDQTTPGTTNAVAQGTGNASNGWYTRAQDSGGGDATDTTNHAVKVNCVVGCGTTSSTPLTSGPIVFTGTTPVTALAAGGSSLYDHVTDIDCTSPGSAPVTVALLNSSSQALWSFTLPAGAGMTKAFATSLGGNGHVAINSAISIQVSGPAFFAPSTGTATISSGTYTSATGLVTLTLSATSPFPAPETMVISGLTGTGSFASLDGTFSATSTSGTTVTYQGPTGLGTVTITGGSIAYNPSVVCNVQGNALTN